MQVTHDLPVACPALIKSLQRGFGGSLALIIPAHVGACPQTPVSAGRHLVWRFEVNSSHQAHGLFSDFSRRVSKSCIYDVIYCVIGWGASNSMGFFFILFEVTTKTMTRLFENILVLEPVSVGFCHSSVQSLVHVGDGWSLKYLSDWIGNWGHLWQMAFLPGWWGLLNVCRCYSEPGRC